MHQFHTAPVRGNEGSTHVSGRFWRSVKYQHLLISFADQRPLWNANGSMPASSAMAIRRKTRSRICGRIGLMNKNSKFKKFNGSMVQWFNKFKIQWTTNQWITTQWITFQWSKSNGYGSITIRVTM